MGNTFQIPWFKAAWDAGDHATLPTSRTAAVTFSSVTAVVPPASEILSDQDK
jgi:hypothetical protein